MSEAGTPIATRAGASGLTPRAILDAAAADLLAYVHKREGKLAFGERYCFVREHVCAAADVRELIALALAQRQRGLQSCKRVTRAIYGDADLLAAALALARAPA
jgi:hypothetical protein